MANNHKREDARRHKPADDADIRSHAQEHHAVRVIVEGEPVPKGRARRGANGGMYTPAESRAWGKHASTFAQMAMIRGRRKLLHGPIKVNIEFHMAIPSSWPAWKVEAALMGSIAHTCKPDRDNLEKAALDALNGIVWADDSQITCGNSVKFYSRVPRTEINVYPIHRTAPTGVRNKAEHAQWTQHEKQ